MAHNIELGSLVEVDLEGTSRHGIRGFVVDHTFDCDGESLYAISLMPLDQAQRLKEYSPGLYSIAVSDHWPETCLKLIREPV